MTIATLNIPIREKSIKASYDSIKRSSDHLINYFLFSYLIGGLILAFFYDTWLVGIAIGSSCLLAYYLSKWLLPESNFYQYVLSVVLAIFMAQYIYQMHGMFEMHFTAFIGCAILITYQNWKLQIPLLLTIVIHHALFGYLQYKGMEEIYFTQLAYMDLQTFIIHAILAGVIVFISGLWAFTLSKNTIVDIEKNIELIRLQGEQEKAEILLVTNTELENARKNMEQANNKLTTEIHERKLIEEKIKGYSQILEKNNKELDQFAYIVSHDLKAPLRAIANLSEWIKEDLGTNLSDDNRNNINLLQGRVQRMQNLITGVLEYSKIGRIKVVPEDINVNHLLTEVIDLLSPPEKFNITVQPDMPSLKTEKILLQQVFANLISNAIKYNDKPIGTINISCTELEQFYEFTVTDNGPGIAPEHHDKVFGIFQTLEARDKVESTGIGLSIVKKIIDEHSGGIRIDSQQGDGAKFIFTWPGSIN